MMAVALWDMCEEQLICYDLEELTKLMRAHYVDIDME